jgi:hypothetical protein
MFTQHLHLFISIILCVLTSIHCKPVAPKLDKGFPEPCFPPNHQTEEDHPFINFYDDLNWELFEIFGGSSVTTFPTYQLWRISRQHHGPLSVSKYLTTSMGYSLPTCNMCIGWNTPAEKKLIRSMWKGHMAVAIIKI